MCAYKQHISTLTSAGELLMSGSPSSDRSSSIAAYRETTSQAELWRSILADPQLQDLPFTIETNEHGQLVLSPHKRIHSIRQTQITDMLKTAIDRPGVRSVELAVQTSKGVKVADAAWMSQERYREIPDDAEPTPIAPELCVEISSTSNTAFELNEKRALYVEAGAEEVWIVGPDGKIRLFDADGEIETSRLASDVPDELPDPA